MGSEAIRYAMWSIFIYPPMTNNAAARSRTCLPLSHVHANFKEDQGKKNREDVATRYLDIACIQSV